MRHIAISLFALVAAGQVGAEDNYPKFEFRNAHLSMTMMIPDAKLGYYRGSRFDWSGVLQNVQYNTRVMFGPWKDAAKHNPTNADDITGPCEEFRTPLGYADAKVGETFLKIGVGTLVKPEEKGYRYNHNYEFKHPGLWKMTRGDDEVVFEQGMLTPSGYGYKYTKTITLLDMTSGFTIRHELQNVGTKPIVTDWYNHNFFNIDGDPIGPKYTLLFPFDAKVAKSGDNYEQYATLKGRSMSFKSVIDKGDIFADIQGFGKAIEHHGFTIQHQTTRVAMSMTADVPLSKLYVWGTKTSICPEPYIAIDLPAGQTQTWTITYKFVTGFAQKR